MEKYTVYKHTNLINGRCYIGMTNNIKRRWRLNGREYKPTKINSRPFWNALEKYGWDNFKHEILFDNLTFEEACEKEIELISGLREKGENLYNVADGGNGGRIYKKHPKGMLGKPQTIHQKESHKKWASKKENNCMTNGKVVWGKTHKHPKGMLGKTHSDEYKQRLSQELRKNPHYSKPLIITYPDGQEKEVISVNEAKRILNIGYSTIKKLITTEKPYSLSKSTAVNKEHLKTLVGLKIRFKDNTEVIGKTKKFPTP